MEINITTGKRISGNFYGNLLDCQFFSMTLGAGKESIVFLSDKIKVVFSVHQAVSEML